MPHSFRIALSLALYLLRSDPFALRGLLLLLPVLTVPLHLPLGIIRYPRYCFIYPCSRRYPRCYAYPRYKVRTPLTGRPCTKGNNLDAIMHPNNKAGVDSAASGIYIVAGLSAIRPGSESDNYLSAFRRYQFSTYKRPLSTAL